MAALTDVLRIFGRRIDQALKLELRGRQLGDGRLQAVPIILLEDVVFHGLPDAREEALRPFLEQLRPFDGLVPDVIGEVPAILDLRIDRGDAVGQFFEDLVRLVLLGSRPSLDFGGRCRTRALGALLLGGRCLTSLVIGRSHADLGRRRGTLCELILKP